MYEPIPITVSNVYEYYIHNSIGTNVAAYCVSGTQIWVILVTSERWNSNLRILFMIFVDSTKPHTQIWDLSCNVSISCLSNLTLWLAWGSNLRSSKFFSLLNVWVKSQIWAEGASLYSLSHSKQSIIVFPMQIDTYNSYTFMVHVFTIA